MNWIDVHAHLEMLESEPEEIIRISKESGVSQMITIGTHPEENKKVLAIAEKFFPVVACTLGVHPHEAKHFDDTAESELKRDCQKKSVVGIGEIGLDYYYNHSEHPVQRDAFRRQLAIAEALKLPIEIHTREAEKDTIEILNEFNGRVTGLFHCFSGTKWLAEKALDLGFDLSFSGIVTFKSADELRSVLKIVPLDRLHIETDSPYLTPVPLRGKKNHPSLLVHTAKFISDYLGIPEDQLSQYTMNNATKLFTRLPKVSA